jgi:uncharacterized protein (DUF2267 family)
LTKVIVFAICKTQLCIEKMDTQHNKSKRSKPSTMLNFNKYVHEGEQFVQEVAVEMKTPWDMIKAVRILRAVLHALRSRLTPEHSLQMIAQFPMLIKAIYVDGWKISDESKTLRHLGDFIEAVREQGGAGLSAHLVTDYEVTQAIHAVFNVIKKHVSKGEIQDILATLPMELRPLMADA